MIKMIRPSKQNYQDQCVRGKCPRHQKGMTGIAMAVVLVVVAFFAMLVLRLFPIYMEHFSVTSHLKSLSSEVGMSKKTNSEIISSLLKRFSIDDVKNVKNEHIFIEREKGSSVTVAIEYEVRTPTISNIDMVVSFTDEVELK